MSLAAGLAVCGAWFLHAFKKSGGLKSDRKTGLLIGLLFSTLGIQNGIMGVGALVFARDPQGIFFSLLISHFFLAIGAMLGVYTAYYIFSPNLRPHLAIIVTALLGILCITLTITTPPQPFITTQNGIDLNMNTRLSVSIFYLLLIAIGSTFFIFSQLYRRIEKGSVKNLSLFLSIFAVIGITNIFVRLVLLRNTDPGNRTRFFDLFLEIIGIGFIGFLVIFPLYRNLLFRLKRLRSKKEVHISNAEN